MASGGRSEQAEGNEGQRLPLPNLIPTPFYLSLSPLSLSLFLSISLPPSLAPSRSRALSLPSLALLPLSPQACKGRYEAAVYACMCGNVARLLPACDFWEVSRESSPFCSLFIRPVEMPSTDAAGAGIPGLGQSPGFSPRWSLIACMLPDALQGDVQSGTLRVCHNRQVSLDRRA